MKNGKIILICIAYLGGAYLLYLAVKSVTNAVQNGENAAQNMWGQLMGLPQSLFNLITGNSGNSNAPVTTASAPSGNANYDAFVGGASVVNPFGIAQ